MTPDWIDARSWAEEQAQAWFLASDVALTVGGVGIGWPLQIDAFDAFLRVAVEAAGLTRDAPGLSIPSTAKRYGFDRALRATAMRLIAGRADTTARRGIAALFVSEGATPSMLEPSIRVARQLPPEGVAVATADPRALRRWRRSGFAATPLTLPWREERRLVTAGRREARDTWEAYAKQAPRFSFAGRDVTKRVLRELRYLVRNSAPWLAVELLALRRIIDECRPSSVVVGTDQHRIGRLVVVACADAPSNVAVLQHGLPQTAIGYMPLVADRIHVWSEGARGWFVDRGADPGRVEVAGNPRMDDLVRLDRATLRSHIDASYGLSGTRRLLVPLSPMGMDANLAVLRMALDALRGEPQFACIVKLHPGAGEGGPIRHMVREAGLPGRIAVLRHEALPPLLLWADVTFLFRSTVALESVAAGTPVVVAEIGPVSIADDELATLDLPRATSGEMLGVHLHQLASDAGRQAYVVQRRAAAERMAGPLDGHSAVRIATSLLESARAD